MLGIVEDDPVLQVVVGGSSGVVADAVHDAFEKAPDGLGHELASAPIPVAGGVVLEEADGAESVAVAGVPAELAELFSGQAVGLDGRAGWVVGDADGAEVEGHEVRIAQQGLGLGHVGAQSAEAHGVEVHPFHELEGVAVGAVALVSEVGQVEEVAALGQDEGVEPIAAVDLLRVAPEVEGGVDVDDVDGPFLSGVGRVHRHGEDLRSADHDRHDVAGHELLADDVKGGARVFRGGGGNDVAEVGHWGPLVHHGQTVELAADPFCGPVRLGAIEAAAAVHHTDKGRHASVQIGTLAGAVDAQDVAQPVGAVRDVEQPGLGGLEPVENGFHRVNLPRPVRPFSSSSGRFSAFP